MNFFQEHRVVRADLANEIREGVRNGAEKKVYLVPDARAKYGNAITLFCPDPARRDRKCQLPH
jgi:hypothetical protein